MKFYDLEIQNLEYEYLTLLNNYESSHAYYRENEEFKASKSLLALLQNIRLLQQSRLSIFFLSYQNLIASKFINYSVLMNHPDTIFFY